MNRFIEGAKFGMLLGAVIGWLVMAARGYGQIEALGIQILGAMIGALIGLAAGVMLVALRARRKR